VISNTFDLVSVLLAADSWAEDEEDKDGVGVESCCSNKDE
jgi:hypothetical protein